MDRARALFCRGIGNDIFPIVAKFVWMCNGFNLLDYLPDVFLKKKPYFRASVCICHVSIYVPVSVFAVDSHIGGKKTHHVWI
jgi:hypothetical protein